jgi:8-oxo-dGTP pyrophosphatase MutT (NUDIX family)
VPAERRHPDRPVEPAATVMLVRDAAPEGVEVFVLRRTTGAAFAAGFYVFPGGRVDAADGLAGDVDVDEFCDGVDDAAASAALGLGRGGAAFWVAAIRECFEESGILLARRRDGTPLAVRDGDRLLVYGGSLSMAELCRRDGLVLDAGALRYVSHWVTPVGESRRFDTRFFVAAAPVGQEGRHDDSETVASRWVRPADALAEFAAGELRLLPPTIANLRFLASASSVAEVLAAADAVGPPPRIEPRLAFDGTRVVGVTMPDGTVYTAPSGSG